MLQNRNHPECAVFVPTGDQGLFRRYNGLTGTPVDAGPADAHGLFDQGGRMYAGRLPAEMALDAMPPGLNPSSAFARQPSAPNNFTPAPELRATNATTTGSRDQGNGNGGGISKETASSLHNMAHRAGVTENDLDAFARVLAALTGADPNAMPTAMDRNGGSRKISRDQAARVWSLAKDKISAAELATLTQMLRQMVDSDLEDEGEGGQTGDEPPNFVGKPRPGGTMVGDQALAAFKSEYGLDRIGHCPPYGEPVPRNRFQKEAAKLALDARERAGGESALEQFAREWPEVVRCGRAY
ncbi:MAG: hypothetical protein ABSD90_15840 [Methylocystis sp.]